MKTGGKCRLDAGTAVEQGTSKCQKTFRNTVLDFSIPRMKIQLNHANLEVLFLLLLCESD